MAHPWRPALAVLCLVTMIFLPRCEGCTHEERTAVLDFRGWALYWIRSGRDDCCRWTGVSCDSSTGRVTGLVPIEGQYLESGLLNATMFLPLQELRSLSLSGLGIRGCLPGAGFDVWSKLHKLKILDLSDNELNDSSMSSLVAVSSIRSLFINYNALRSTQTIQQLSMMQLETLDISFNAIDGIVSTDICNLKNLQELHLRDNMIAGELPSCIGNLTSLRPDQEEFMTKSRHDFYKGKALNYMYGLDFSSNKFSGPIPESIGSMEWLRALNFSDNYLDGSIPRSLSNLSKLESLDLSHNNLAGQIPSELVVLQSLEVFSVAYNNLSGPTLGRKGQFITFDNSSYEGNPYLCGPPLLKSCSKPPSTPPTEEHGEEDDDQAGDIILFGCSAMFYLVGFWTSLGVLYFKTSWRWSWFSGVDRFGDFVMVKFYVFTRKIRSTN